MAQNSHGVSPKKIRKSPPKTKKRLVVKAERLAAQAKAHPSKAQKKGGKKK